VCGVPKTIAKSDSAKASKLSLFVDHLPLSCQFFSLEKWYRMSDKDEKVPSSPNVGFEQTGKVMHHISSEFETTDGIENSILSSERIEKAVIESLKKESEDTSDMNNTSETRSKELQTPQVKLDTTEMTDDFSSKDEAKISTDLTTADLSTADPTTSDPLHEMDSSFYSDIMMKQPQKDLTREQLQQIIA
jgi:hypothetical protein